MQASSMTRNHSQIAIIHIKRICQAGFCGGLLGLIDVFVFGFDLCEDIIE